MPEKKNSDNIWNEENIPQSSFFKFAKVGDRVTGTLIEVKDKPAKDVFPAQRVFVLKKDDGSIANVGIALDKDYVIGRANTAQLGDTLGFEFKKEIPASKKGFSPAKSIEVYVIHAAPVNDEAF